MSRLPRRQGLTLIEVLVVFSVIGVLMALIIPAVQAARESARKTQCKNNLRQIGLALQTYHDLHQQFPINYGNGNYDATNTGASWLQQILPQIDQSNLHAKIQFGKPVADLENEQVAKTPVALYLCPSDSPGNGVLGNRANVGSELAVTNYKACAGSNWAWGKFSPSSSPSGRFKSDTDGLEHGNGIIPRGGGGVPVSTRIGQIRDGLGQTIAIGEAVPGWTRHTWWYWFNASTATCAIELNHGIPADALTEPDDAWHDNYSFMSRHAGGGHFGMVDGSVRFVSEDIDLTVYRNLATIDGGEVVGEF